MPTFKLDPSTARIPPLEPYHERFAQACYEQAVEMQGVKGKTTRWEALAPPVREVWFAIARRCYTEICFCGGAERRVVPEPK